MQKYNKYLKENFVVDDQKSLLATKKIVVGDSEGTAFLFRYKKEIYLVTAKHVLINKNHYKNKKVSIFDFNDNVVTFNANLYYHDNKHIDICVIHPYDKIYNSEVLEYKNETIFHGSFYDVYGFSDDISTSLGLQINNGNSIKVPILKRTTLSQVDIRNEAVNFVFDGIIPDGFSGSPVVGYSKKGKRFVIGVASKQSQYIEKTIDIKDENDKTYVSIPNSYFYAVHILHVIEIIENKILGEK